MYFPKNTENTFILEEKTYNERKKLFAIKSTTNVERKAISQILMISVQKDSPRLQEGPPNQPGRPLHLRTPMNSLDRKGVGGW